VSGSDRRPPTVDGGVAHHSALALLLVAALSVPLAVAAWGLPRANDPLPAAAREAMGVALPRWHLPEAVNEIVYGTRGFDTFGETFLLLAAVVSVLVVTRRREHRAEHEGEEREGERERAETDPRVRQVPTEVMARRAEIRELEPLVQPRTPDATPVGTREIEPAAAMSVVARTAVRLAAPALTVTGMYLMLWGFSPGGGFPAGVVLLGVALLAYTGFGHERVAKVVDPELLERLEIAGAIVIITTQLAGLALRGHVGQNWLPLAPAGTIRSGGILQVFSGSELVEVGTGLALAIFAFLAMGHDWAHDGGPEQPGEP
jgi:multicomponent Na+:H+ antiporter subunit B